MSENTWPEADSPGYRAVAHGALVALVVVMAACANAATEPPAGTATPDATPDATSPDGADGLSNHIDAPDVPPLDASLADIVAPDTAAPDTAAPDTAAPDTATPDTAAPDTAAPDTSSLPDAALDVSPDVGPDVGPGAEIDTTPDVPLDAAPDAVPDAAPDAVPDAAPDVAPDAGAPPNLCADKTCDDGDPCNGPETCDAATGACVAAPQPACPYAPAECKQSGGAGDATKFKLKLASAAGFRMVDTKQWAASTKLIDSIGAHASAKVVPLSAVLSDLNRTGVKLSKVPSVTCVQRAFAWNSGDSNVDYWWPQGLTGSWDGSAGGTYAGKQVLIATWYHKPQEDPSTSVNKGARLSVADVSGSGAPKYRLVLLVEPVAARGGKVTFKPVVFHAGGAAWFGDYLYVPHTTQGFRVFDLKRFVKVQTGDKAAVGWSAKHKAYHAMNYRYVLPQVGRYQLCKTCCARFSFVSVDRSTAQPSLLTGAYAKSDHRARLHRWPLDPKTGRLVTTSGLVQSDLALFPGVRRMQGALTLGSKVWISSSDAYPGASGIASLYGYAKVGAPLVTRKLPRVPEDVTYQVSTGALWTHTELPGKRWVWAMPAAKLTSASCK